MKYWLGRIFVMAVGLSLTALPVAVSFNPFFLAGSGWPTIWGPAIGKPAVAIGAMLLIGAAAWTAGRVRVALLLLWLVFLACTTHRLVERSGGLVDDVWFGFAVQRLEEDRGEPVASRCRVGTWVAQCVDASGRTLTSVTPLPFVQLSPGLWERTDT